MFRRVLAATLAGFAALVAPTVASADTVTQWNQNAANSLYVTAAQPPNVSVLHMAMVQGAVYDAVNAIDGSREGYLITSRVATPTDSKDAAAATAAYKVLLNIVPAQEPALTALYNASLAGISDGTAKTRGIAVGNAAAAAMIAARTDDGRFGLFRFVNGTTPGAWRPVLPAFGSDPNAWVKDVKPFLIKKASQFRSSGPYELTSRKYAREFEEVKRVGSASAPITDRSLDQTEAALYWAENPPRTWNRILNSLSASRGVSLVENARLFAEVYLTVADAFIAVWDEKAHYSFWRPITAIREADTDGNHRTTKDENWLPLVANPGVPGPSLRPPRSERRGRENPAGVLPHGQARVDGHERRGAHPQLHAGLGRDRGDRRRPRLVGDPLPERRRGECPDLAADREVPRPALLQPDPPRPRPRLTPSGS